LSTLLKRAHRVLLVVVAAVFGLSLLAPMAALASSDLVPGDQAIIDNPDGTGANLRSDFAVLDDSTLVTEVAQRTTVNLIDGPIVADNGTWFRVAVPGVAEGFISASLLLPFQTEDTGAGIEADGEVEAEVSESEEVTMEETTSPDLLRQEPIDVGFVVDNNNELPVDGLACRAAPSLDGEVLARIPTSGSVEVVSPRIWQGDLSFVHINCADGAGYVNGAYVVLDSEEVPEVEEPVADESVTEDAALEASTVEEPVVEVPEVEVPAVEIPAVEVPAVEVPAVEIPAVEVPAVEVPAVEIPEAPVVDNSVAAAAVTPESTDAEVSAAAVADEPVLAAEAPVVPEVPEVPAVDEPVVPEVPEIPVVDVVDEPKVADETTVDPTTDDQALEDVSEETSTVANEAVADVPVVPEEPAAVAAEATTTDEPALAAAAAPAVSAPASDISLAIGSATVTGTNEEGVRCRIAPSDDAATLMVLEEGTKVFVLSEPTNGYLGIDCGGLQGFADVDYLWSGGAADGEIQSSSMSLVVTGTGNGLNCRTGAGTNFPVITVLTDGTTLTTRGAASNGWAPVVCAGQNGYVATPYIQVSGGSTTSALNNVGTSTGTATVSNTAGEGLRCRSGAGTTYSVIMVLGPSATVTVRGANQGEWTPVVCGGANGWAHSAYLTVGAPTSTNTTTPALAPSGMVSGDHAKTTANLNLRYSASLGSSVAAVAPAGTVVLITGGATNGFYPVDWNGLKGFMSGDYLTRTSEALSQRGGSASPGAAPAPAPTTGGSATGNAIVDYAMGYLGYPYVWATAGPASFDCSGFTYWVVKNVLGIDIGRGTWTQVAAGTPVSRSSLQPGDLVFHQNTYTAGLSHVGIYIGNNKMINALNENAGVVISDITSDYWESRWYGARRL
jgi:cell wall-associated NlpC family hydrolase